MTEDDLIPGDPADAPPRLHTIAQALLPFAQSHGGEVRIGRLKVDPSIWIVATMRVVACPNHLCREHLTMICPFCGLDIDPEAPTLVAGPGCVITPGGPTVLPMVCEGCIEHRLAMPRRPAGDQPN
jgi:hypothetical protein